jgi:hypothetical protein
MAPLFEVLGVSAPDALMLFWGAVVGIVVIVFLILALLFRGRLVKTTKEAPPAFLSRCIVLQAVGASGVVGLWIAGIAQKPFEGDNAPLCWMIMGVAIWGILNVFRRNWIEVLFIAKNVVRLGLIGTVVGLIIAFSAAGAAGGGNVEEFKATFAFVMSGMYISLYATLLGLVTNLWLHINRRYLGGPSDG